MKPVAYATAGNVIDVLGLNVEVHECNAIILLFLI